MSNLTLGQLTSNNPISNLITVAAGDTIYSPGSVVQVVNTTIYTPTAVSIPNNAIAYTNVPDLIATITPKSVHSKIYIIVKWFGEFAATNIAWDSMFGIKRNTIPIGENPNTPAGAPRGIYMSSLSYYSNDASSTPETCVFDYYDSPSTVSPIEYQVCINSVYAGTMYTNRTVTAGSAPFEYGSSSITVWEIAQ